MKIESKISNTKLNYDITSKTVNTSGNKIKDIISNATVEGYNGSINPEIVNVSNINLPNNNGIYDPNNNYYTEFGGNQGELIMNIENYIEDPKIREIITKYYPEADLSADNLELLFYRMNSVGCGYIAGINTILRAYEASGHDELDFYARFGFPPYDLRTNQVSGHKMDKDYNYEYLFLDFFLYSAKNVRGFNTLEEAIGNTEEEIAIRNGQAGDLALDDEDFKIEGMHGLYLSDLTPLIFYLKEKGINMEMDYGEMSRSIRVEPGTERYEEFRSQMSYEVPDGTPLNAPITVDDFRNFLNEGKQVIISAKNFTLYYPDDVDGNGKYDDIYQSNIGGHAMCVVGVTEDDKLIVSSWGNEYLFELGDPPAVGEFDERSMNDFIIFDYGNFDPVEY